MDITIQNLHFSYPGRKVLDDINFNIKAGEVTCIAGPNGSGKSTLIKCINKLFTPEKGIIRYNERESTAFSLNETARLIGYVPQSQNQAFATTVFDTVLMGRRPYSYWQSGNEDLEIVSDILWQLHLEDIALQLFNQLSGGQQQQVMLARALAGQPEILLLDEPTSALDLAHQLEVMEIIHSLAVYQRLTVVMVVHDLNLASRYADKIVLIKQGRIHDAGRPVAVLTKTNIREIYSVEADIADRNGMVVIAPLYCTTANVKPESILLNENEFASLGPVTK